MNMKPMSAEETAARVASPNATAQHEKKEADELAKALEASIAHVESDGRAEQHALPAFLLQVQGHLHNPVGDGNCLFSSRKMVYPDVSIAAQRASTAACIDEHFNVFLGTDDNDCALLLLDQVVNINERQLLPSASNAEERKVRKDAYIKLIKSTSKFAYQPEMMALSHVYRHAFVVYQFDRRQEKFIAYSIVPGAPVANGGANAFETPAHVQGAYEGSDFQVVRTYAQNDVHFQLLCVGGNCQCSQEALAGSDADEAEDDDEQDDEEEEEEGSASDSGVY
jgi:hypothetical protein